MPDRVVKPAAAVEDRAEVEIGAGVVRLDFQGPLEVRSRFVPPPLTQQREGQIVVRHPVPGVAGQRVLEDRLGIAPVRRLPPRRGHQDCQQGRDRETAPRASAKGPRPASAAVQTRAIQSPICGK